MLDKQIGEGGLILLFVFAESKRNARDVGMEPLTTMFERRADDSALFAPLQVVQKWSGEDIPFVNEFSKSGGGYSAYSRPSSNAKACHMLRLGTRSFAKLLAPISHWLVGNGTLLSWQSDYVICASYCLIKTS